MINVSSVIRITMVYILWWSQYLNHSSDSLSQSIFAVVSYKQVMTCIHLLRTNAVLCLQDYKCRWRVFNKGLLFKYIHNMMQKNTKNNRVPPAFNSPPDTVVRACCPDHQGCMGAGSLMPELPRGYPSPPNLTVLVETPQEYSATSFESFNN